MLRLHLVTYRHDEGAHAVDVIRFLSHDRILLSAGYTGIAQFASASNGSVVGRVALSGRASSVAIHSYRNLIAFGTQSGVDLVEYGEDANAPTPQLVARATLSERVRDVLFDPTNESILFGTFEGTIGSLPLMTAGADWKPREQTQMRDRMGATIGIMGLVADWDRGQLAVVDIEGEVHCVELRNLARPSRTAKHTSEIFGVDRHPWRPAAIVSDSSGGLALLNVESCTFEGAIASTFTAQTVARDSGGEWRGARVMQAARTGIRYSRDGKLVGVAGHDGTVRIYTANDHALIRVVALGDATRSLDFDASGERLAVGSDSGAISMWELATVESWGVAGTETFAVDPRGRWVIARGDDQHLRVLDAATGMVRATFTSDDSSPSLNDLDAMVVTPDGSSLAGRFSGSTSVPVWSLASVERDGTLPPPIQLQHSNVRGHVALVSALGVTPNSELITAERRDGHSVRVWKPQSGAERLSVRLENPVFQVAAAAERLAAIDNRGLLRVVSLATETEIASARLQWQPQALALAPDGQTLFVAGASGERILGAVCAIGGAFPTEALWRRLMRWPPLSVSAKAVTPRSARAPIMTTGLACLFLDFKDGVRDAAFSPDGRRLAIGVSGAALTQPGTLMLLDAHSAWSGRQERTPAAIRTIAFSPDSRVLAVGMQERGITLWRIDDMTTEAAIPLANPVRRLAFLPDADRKLVSLDGIRVGVLRIWDWRREVLISAGCERWPEAYAVRPIPSVPEPPQRSVLCGS
jgi:WD40 repeat protein